jgi:hypothetical protein
VQFEQFTLAELDELLERLNTRPGERPPGGRDQFGWKVAFLLIVMIVYIPLLRGNFLDNTSNPPLTGLLGLGGFNLTDVFLTYGVRHFVEG